MRLSKFIGEHKEEVLQEWEDFARSLQTSAMSMSDVALRDHASLMLDVIAVDLESTQSRTEQNLKSRGKAAATGKVTMAELHADQRLAAGFGVGQLVSEYRALRASVLKLWADSSPDLVLDPRDVMRFNEAIDQALSESVARFSMFSFAASEDARRRLDAVRQAAPVGICLADKDGQILLANVESRGNWGEHLPPVAAYGAWRGLLRSAPIRDAFAQVVGSVEAQADITDQVKTQAALRESEAKFRTIADAMPQMVWSTRPDGFHDYYNQRWYDFTGADPSKTEGNGWNGMFHPDDQERAWALWQHSLATGEPYEVQYRLLHHSGQYRWALGRALPIRGETGEITRWMGTCTDIHEQKATEQELKKQASLKDQFLAMLAHELRNPLAPISTAAQLLLLDGADEKRARRAGEIITRQVRHMTELVDDLLDVSRFTRGLVELEKSNLDVKDVVNNAIEQARPLIEFRKHRLHVRFAPASAPVAGDKTRLVQVLANLLTNAAKYTPQGGNIWVSVDVDASTVHIDVKDDGSGIPSSVLPHVFELFAQAERTPDRSQGGLGLGLSLAKHVTNLHGGQITAKSEGNAKGSVFTVVLPKATPFRDSDESERSRNLEPTAQPLRTLIVDDNVDAGKGLAALLTASGHDAEFVEDAPSALERASKDRFEVFILDIGLPGMNGYDLARRLREDATTRGTCLIALTGYGQPQDRVLSKSAGFDHHLVKPADTHLLMEILSTVASAHRGKNG